MRSTLLAAVLVALAGHAHAEGLEQRGPYVGTVAGQPVVARVAVERGQVVGGLFFYRRFGRDLALQLSDGSSLVECPATRGEPVRDCAQNVSGLWRVQLDGTRLVGTWRDPRGGAARPVELVLKTGTPVDAAYNAERDAERRDLVAGRGRVGPVTWDVLREQRSQMQGFRITGGMRAAAQARINADLATLHKESIDAVLQNDLTERNGEAFVFANERLLAYTYTLAWEGGAHPSFAYMAITWDTVTGERVDWRKRLRFSSGSTGRIDVMQADTVDALALRELVADSRRPEAERNDCFLIVLRDAGCAGSSCAAAAVSQMTWKVLPTRDGLSMAPDAYSEAERSCRGEAVVLPWASVQHARRGNAPLP